MRILTSAPGPVGLIARPRDGTAAGLAAVHGKLDAAARPGRNGVRDRRAVGVDVDRLGNEDRQSRLLAQQARLLGRRLAGEDAGGAAAVVGDAVLGEEVGYRALPAQAVDSVGEAV